MVGEWPNFTGRKERNTSDAGIATISRMIADRLIAGDLGFVRAMAELAELKDSLTPGKIRSRKQRARTLRRLDWMRRNVPKLQAGLLSFQSKAPEEASPRLDVNAD